MVRKYRMQNELFFPCLNKHQLRHNSHISHAYEKIKRTLLCPTATTQIV